MTDTTTNYGAALGSEIAINTDGSVTLSAEQIKALHSAVGLDSAAAKAVDDARSTMVVTMGQALTAAMDRLAYTGDAQVSASAGGNGKVTVRAHADHTTRGFDGGTTNWKRHVSGSMQVAMNKSDKAALRALSTLGVAAEAILEA